jgi:hypothetical protein
MKLTSREISKELHNACFKGEPCGGYYAEGGFTRNLEGKPKPARLWLKLKEHNLI